MRRQSPAAAAILALPHWHHPRLRAAVEALARKPGMTAAMARDVLDLAGLEFGITGLDIELAPPGAAPDVPFSPTRHVSPAAQFREGVTAHVAQLLGHGQPAPVTRSKPATPAEAFRTGVEHEVQKLLGVQS